MDNHPIPQNITGFEFKLIGDMTIKQFAYLATGTVLGWIAFSLPVSFIVKFPFMAIFLSFGVSFAFFSIEGRPVDTMIFNFIKAVFSPTQYVYQRSLITQPLPNETKKEDETVLKGTAAAPQVLIREENKLDKKEFDFFHMLSQMLTPLPNAPIQTGGTEPPAQTPPPEKKEEEIKTEVLTKELEKAKEEEKILQEKGAPLEEFQNAHEKVLELEKTLSQTVLEKQRLEQELVELKKQLEQTKKEQVYKPTVAEELKETQNVRVIPKELGKAKGVPTPPQYPNVISGIVKDPRGNPLQNILVEVKDFEGNPVRAFKTNALGQFNASTALGNGKYTILFEDPSGLNKFDSVAFEAKGDIILPIEVISVDTREELRRSLFK